MVKSDTMVFVFDRRSLRIVPKMWWDKTVNWKLSTDLKAVKKESSVWTSWRQKTAITCKYTDFVLFPFQITSKLESSFSFKGSNLSGCTCILFYHALPRLLRLPPGRTVFMITRKYDCAPLADICPRPAPLPWHWMRRVPCENLRYTSFIFASYNFVRASPLPQSYSTEEGQCHYASPSPNNQPFYTVHWAITSVVG